jgi:hypothetical protein
MKLKSQEWTPEYVGGLVGETFNGAWAIAEAHNAALAAERKKVKPLVEALYEIATTGTDTLDGYEAAKIASDALAKVKEGK